MNFTRKTSSPQPPAAPWFAAGWAAVQNQFPPGRTFAFMTQTLVVSHYGATKDGTPELVTRYLTADGKIAREVFSVNEIPLLLAIDAAQQPPAPPQAPPTGRK